MRINTLGGLVSTLNERNKRLEHQVNVLFALFVVCGLGFCAALSRKVSKPDAALVDSPKEAPHDSGS